MARPKGALPNQGDATRVYKAQQPVSDEVIERVTSNVSLLDEWELKIARASFDYDNTKGARALGYTSPGGFAAALQHVCDKVGIPRSKPLYQVDRRDALRRALARHEEMQKAPTTRPQAAE